VTSIAIIGSKGIPARYGGFETLAENLVKHLANEHPITVYCSARAYETHRPTYLGAKLVYMPFNSNGLQSIPYDVFSMLSARRRVDVLLILGVSGCAFLPLIKLFSKKKYIVHLDGIDWRRPKWGWLARNFLRFSEWVAAESADCLIADNAAIQNYIFESYGKDSVLIEYGGDHSTQGAATVDDSAPSKTALNGNTQTPISDRIETGFSNYAFSVCRIEPENNIHVILKAFEIAAPFPLVIVGNWSSSKYGLALRKKYGGLENIHLLDPVYDPVKLFELRSNASLYLHGHSAGGTNPSLVEAMYLGLPVIAFDVVFNKETTHHKARYFLDAESLRDALHQFDHAELAIVAQRMRNISQFRYTWNVIAEKYSYLFNALAQNAIEDVGIGTVIDGMPERSNRPPKNVSVGTGSASRIASPGCRAGVVRSGGRL